MTWTSAFGRACGWLLDRIVHGLALTRISPERADFYRSGDQHCRGVPVWARERDEC